jgi:Autotransporter beta-domain
MVISVSPILSADYLIKSSILIGALIQYNWMSEKSKSLGSSVEGHGAMAGPYVSARITPNVFFDARAAWGTSDNTVNPYGIYNDKFGTDRWLAHANLTGNWRFGDYRFTPSAGGLTYIEEVQHAYIDRVGVLIPSQTVRLGRLAIGPEIAYRYLAANGASSR